MKINEQALLSYASDSTPPDKTGFLLKKGEVNKGFQRRYFVLRGNMLFYFEKQHDKEPVGVIILENCHVELCMSDMSTFAFQIVFDGSGTRRYVLAAKDNDEMESWMRRITHAGYDYMKTMVEELEKRLETLKQTESEMTCKDAQSSTENLSTTLSSSRPEGSEQPKTPHKKPFSRAKNQTLPAIRIHKRDKVFPEASSSNRFSFSSGVPNSHAPTDLPEVEPDFQDLIHFSERTDVLYDNSFHSSRHFSINDFTPPSFSELKKHEAIEDQTLFDIKCDHLENEFLTFSNTGLATRFKDVKRVNSERHRPPQQISLPQTSMDDLFAYKRKLSMDDAQTTDEYSNSNFQHLHSVWGASIWVKVHEYEPKYDRAVETIL